MWQKQLDTKNNYFSRFVSCWERVGFSFIYNS
jgi:hypothetical protein